MGEDQIPPKLIKTAGNFLVDPLTNIINSWASVTPIDISGTDKHIYINYRSVCVLDTFSKIVESLIFDQLTKHANEFLQIFMGAYRKLYSSQHILIRLVEEWKTQLERNKIFGPVLLHPSKAFDCITHDLLIAKLDAYCFDKKAFSLIYSYLKNRK